MIPKIHDPGLLGNISTYHSKLRLRQCDITANCNYGNVILQKPLTETSVSSLYLRFKPWTPSQSRNHWPSGSISGIMEVDTAKPSPDETHPLYDFCSQNHSFTFPIFVLMKYSYCEASEKYCTLFCRMSGIH